MFQPLISVSDSHEPFTTLLLLDASFVMMPRGASKSIPNSNLVLRPKDEIASADGFKAKPPNPLERCLHYASSTISTRVTIVLDITKSSNASA